MSRRAPEMIDLSQRHRPAQTSRALTVVREVLGLTWLVATFAAVTALIAALAYLLAGF